MDIQDLREARKLLEEIYARYNRRELIHPDPLEFLWRYEKAVDREIVGLLASSLAYGRVAAILGSVERILGELGPSPSGTLKELSGEDLFRMFPGFKHRFSTSREVTGMLYAASRLQEEWGSLGELFHRRLRESYGSLAAALDSFVNMLLEMSGMERSSLLPRPARGSACKRLNLYLRWMVRRDEVDPGSWRHVDPSLLMVPLDVHMHEIGRAMGMTGRKSADWTTAEEVTAWFRMVNPEDPVKYDFALTRMGILDRGDDSLFRRLADEFFIDIE